MLVCVCVCVSGWMGAQRVGKCVYIQQTSRRDKNYSFFLLLKSFLSCLIRFFLSFSFSFFSLSLSLTHSLTSCYMSS